MPGRPNVSAGASVSAGGDRTGQGRVRGRGRGGKRPPADGGGPAVPKRPAASSTGVRANIGTVSNDGNRAVNNIAGNVHGFQKGGAAAAGGSRTVTVPVRRGGRGGRRGGGQGRGGSDQPSGGGDQRPGGGDQRPGGGEGGQRLGGGGGGDQRLDGADGGGQRPGGAGGGGGSFEGRGHVLGGAGGVPWYKRDPAPRAAGAAFPAAPSTPIGAPPARAPTGIFTSPEKVKPTPDAADDWDGPISDSGRVTCPVCGERVSLSGVNDHVDRCLVAECERLEGSGQPDGGAEVGWQEYDDELLLSRAADELETSLRDCEWQDADSEDDRLLAAAADHLETSLVHEQTAAGGTAQSPHRHAGAAGGEPVRGAAVRTASEASTVCAELLENSRRTRARTSSDASTVYDEILDEPIVIDSSDDEDYATQRNNLSDVIKDFITVEESDDDLFDE